MAGDSGVAVSLVAVTNVLALLERSPARSVPGDEEAHPVLWKIRIMLAHKTNARCFVAKTKN